MKFVVDFGGQILYKGSNDNDYQRKQNEIDRSYQDC